MPTLLLRTTPRYAMCALVAVVRAWRGRRHACRPGYLAVLLACATCETMAQPVRPAHPAIPLEYAVKATYLYKLAPFVNWPPTAFAAPDTPFRICVVGDDPFDDFLENAVTGRRFGTHPFAVRRLDTLSPGADCQIVFISRMPSQGMRQALEAVRGKPVLTVVDSTVPVQGGIVQFVMDHGRVGFDIDTAAAARNHITLSSKLLNLALAVRDES